MLRKGNVCTTTCLSFRQRSNVIALRCAGRACLWYLTPQPGHCTAHSPTVLSPSACYTPHQVWDPDYGAGLPFYAFLSNSISLAGVSHPPPLFEGGPYVTISSNPTVIAAAPPHQLPQTPMPPPAQPPPGRGSGNGSGSGAAAAAAALSPFPLPETVVDLSGSGDVFAVDWSGRVELRHVVLRNPPTSADTWTYPQVRRGVGT